MVHQWQEFFYDKDFFATVYSGNPDFVKLAEALRHHRHTGYRQDPGGGGHPAGDGHPRPGGNGFLSSSRMSRFYPMIPAGESVNEMMEEPIPERIF